MSDRWVVVAVAWSPVQVAQMHASLAVVRDWLAADGADGLGMDTAQRWAVRQRALASGLTGRESWLVWDTLVADTRRLTGPGGRVQERAKRVTAAVTGALEAQTGLRPRPVAPRGSVDVLGRSEVTRYAVAEHDWQRDNPAVVAEDLPWSAGVDRAGMRVLPVTWTGILADPIALGLDGDSWQVAWWKFGHDRPPWADDPGARARVFAYLRAFGWSGTPLRADLDEVEPYLPTKRLVHGRSEVAWLVPGHGGWALAWRVDPARTRA